MHGFLAIAVGLGISNSVLDIELRHPTTKATLFSTTLKTRASTGSRSTGSTALQQEKVVLEQQVNVWKKKLQQMEEKVNGAESDLQVEKQKAEQLRNELLKVEAKGKQVSKISDAQVLTLFRVIFF